MSRYKQVFAIVTILVIVTIPQVFAGVVTEQLADHLTKSSGDDFVRVVIRPRSDHNAAAFKANLVSEYRLRSDRHRIGIEQLKTLAAYSQAEINTLLSDMTASGRAQNVKSFWVTNIIEADVRADAIDQLAAMPQIDDIHLYPEISSPPLPSVKSSSNTKALVGVEPNLAMVNADSAWALGYDGSGRLVCNFDSGVDALHPALDDNYRGNKGYPWQQCWFSPVDSSTVPHAFANTPSNEHGTHTMGIIVGHDDATGDTIGVAPGADWIAAVAIDVPGSSIFEAFQWAADPDGDPNTVTDLPDVINHSWGVPGIGCSDIFWEAIDNLEALGIVNIFAAGNERDTLSIRNPANRADDSLTSFAVGNLRVDDSTLWSGSFGSSRGPSDCDSVSIKPNVSAPGYTIRSALPGGTYANRYGTSMAAPHVAGAVAILRQKNPDATVDEIKNALLNSAIDLGEPGPDILYGWGMIDIIAALDLVSPISTPNLQVENLAYGDIYPGDTLNLTLEIKNIGPLASDVYVEFSNPDAGVSLGTTQITFGDITNGAIVTGTPTLDLIFSDALTTGQFYSLDMTVFENTTQQYVKRLNFFVGSPGVRSYFNLDINNVSMTISNYGAFGFHGTTTSNALTGSFIPYGFDGFKLAPETFNTLYEGALMIGTAAEHISDCAQNFIVEPDNDFKVLPGGSITEIAIPFVDQATTCLFDDSRAESPIGVEVRQNTFAWANPPDDDYIIVEYIITNRSDSTISDLRVGLFMDWDIPLNATTTSSLNLGDYVPGDDLGYIFYENGADSQSFRGVKIVNDEGMVNYRVYDFFSEIWDGRFSEQNKSLGLFDNYAQTSDLGEVAHTVTTGPFSLAPGETDTAAFAIVGGPDWLDFLANATQAEARYAVLTDTDDDFDDSPLPRQLMVYQNYPNPFNPSTTIAFSLPRAGDVSVEVFNIVGQRVAVVHDNRLPAGEQQVIWDGTDDNGKPVASGIYLYRVRFDNDAITRKMIMLK